MTEVRAKGELRAEALASLGINDVAEIVYNPSYELLFEEEDEARTGRL